MSDTHVVARLDNIERALFGHTFVIVDKPAVPVPATPQQRPHECVPSIVELDVKEYARKAFEALAEAIRFESATVRLLRGVQREMKVLQNDPTLLDEDARRSCTPFMKGSMIFIKSAARAIRWTNGTGRWM